MNGRIQQTSIIQSAVVGDNSASALALTNIYQDVAHSNSFIIKVGDIVKIKALGRIYNHSGTSRTFGHNILTPVISFPLEPTATLATGLTTIVRLEADISVFSLLKSNLMIKVTSTLTAPENTNVAYTERALWKRITAADVTNGGVPQSIIYQAHDGTGVSGCDFYLDSFVVEQIKGALVQ